MMDCTENYYQNTIARLEQRIANGIKLMWTYHSLEQVDDEAANKILKALLDLKDI